MNLWAAAAACSTAGGGAGICYVDMASAGGDGTTTATAGAQAAYQHIAEVNALTYAAGDQILFKRGATWREQLTVPTSGSAGTPIVIGAYGTGVNPIISGADVLTGWAAIESAEETGGSFASGFETAALGDWTGTTTTGASIARSATAKHNTTYGMLYTVTDAASCQGWASKTFTEISSGSVYARFYFYIPTGTVSTSKTWSLFKLFDGATDVFVVQAIADGAGALTLNAYINNPWAQISTGTTAISRDAWHYIEVKYTIHATTGGGEVWFDGASKGSNALKDTSALKPDNIQIGQTGFGTISALNSTAYFDDVKVDTSAIGASASAPANAYSITLAADPEMVWFDGTHGKLVASVAALSADKDFYYTGTTLSILSTSAPAGRTIEGGARSYGIDTNSKDYITVQNLTLQGTKEWGAGVRCYVSQYCVVDSCTLTKNYYYGFLGSGDSHGNMTVSNCTISYNGSGGIISWYAAPHVDDGNNLYTRNTINYNGWRNVENSPIISAANDTTYSYNTIHDNNTAADNPDHLTHNHGIYLGAAGLNITGQSIHHNTIYNQGAGSGIKMLASGNIYNNFSYNNYQGGITVGFNDTIDSTVNIYYNICSGNYQGIWLGTYVSGAFTANIYNNVLYNNNNTALNEYTAGISVAYDVPTALLIKNNIIYAPTGVSSNEYSMVTQTHMTSDYNLFVSGTKWYNAGSRNWATWQGYGFDEHSLNATDPLFISASDFRLRAGSPAINAGVSVGLVSDYSGGTVPKGSAPDIGAYEFGAGYQMIWGGTLLLGGMGIDADRGVLLRQFPAMEGF
jgi:hypothetical protein